MEPLHQKNPYPWLQKDLTINCEECWGLCCVALYFSKSDGFPSDKLAGKPCVNLLENFRCKVYAQCQALNLKGCLSFDCFGAGQKVAQKILKGKDWQSHPENAQKIFDLFFIIYRLHQILWYLQEAAMVVPQGILRDRIDALVEENLANTERFTEALLGLDVEACQKKVNLVLMETCGFVAKKIGAAPLTRGSKDFAAKDFKAANLQGKDFSMSLLIAANLEGCNLYGANFLGADLRDANVANVDLTESLFLTQMQVNTAKGNQNTKLPKGLLSPSSWVD